MGNDNGINTEKTGQEAREALEQLGREFRERADGLRQEVVKQLLNAADTIRKQVRENKVEGDAREQADRLAKGLDKAAKYLNSRSVDQWGDEAVRVVRKNPWRALAVVFVVGLIVGIFLRRD